MVLVLDLLAEGVEAGLQVIVDQVLVEGQLVTLLDLLPSVVQPLHDRLLGLSPPASQPLLERLETRGLDEEEVAVDLVIVDLLSSLDVNVQNANLFEKTSTLPRFIISISLPLWVP